MDVAARRPSGFRTEVVAALASVGYGALLNRLLPDVVHVPANLTAAATSMVAARGLGLSASDLGLAPSRVPAGVRTGLAVAVPLLAGIGVAAAMPATRRFFDDARVRESSHPYYETALRIPIGTALSEELIFRGALLGLVARRHSPAVAVAFSSLLFGIWHILPAHDAHTANRRPVTDDAVRFASAPTVLATVAATTAAGCGLAWLRLRSGSVLAPTVVHAAVNIGAFVAVRAQITLRGR